MGPIFLTFLAIVLFGSLALFFRRRKGMTSEAIPGGVFERRNTFLLNNILLVGAAFVILFGTIFPLLSEALTGLKIEVGKSFFNQMVVPLLLGIVFLSGLCILVGWRRSQSGQLKRKLLWPVATTSILGIVLLISGISKWYALVAFMVLGFAFSATLSEWLRDLLACGRMKTGSYLGNLGKFINAQRSRYGGHIVHLGIAIMAIGVTGSSFYDMEREVTLKPGDTIEINNYSLTYEKLENRGGLNKMTIAAELLVRKGGRTLGKLSPAVQFHRNFEQSVSEVAIRSNLTEDLYVVLAGWDEQHNAAFKIKISPLVSWIWVGGGVFLFGGLIAFWPTRAEKEKSA
jgi:cytochrome c-type biogenesis protein CcmF